MILALLGCQPRTETDAVEDDTGELAPSHDDLAWSQLRARVKERIRNDDVPGYSVAVVIDGKLAYAEGFGVTQYGGDEPVTTDTVFRWASVSKMHTATALLQLVEDGTVDLDAPVTDVLSGVALEPGFDPATITPRHLLTHTSALPDALWWSCDTDDGELQDRVTTWEPPLYAPPGSFYNYSNSGYVWIGALLEQATGEPFVQLMDERVLQPAGMTTATFDADVASEGEHATGTGWDDGPVDYGLRRYDCGWGRPAAWLHGTATDLARTAEWQLAGGGSLLSHDTVEAMHAQVDTHYTPDGSSQVGFGQFTNDYRGLDLVWHDGWVTGFVSTWAIVPDRGFGVVTVSNADWADPYGVMYDALDFFLEPDGDTPDYTTDPSTWTPYAGTYVDPYVYGTVVVTLVDGAMRADFVDLGLSAELVQSAGDAFYLHFPDDTWSDARFVADRSGAFTWFVQRTGVATRQDVAAAVPPTIDADRARALLARYALHEPPDPARPIGPDGWAPRR